MNMMNEGERRIDVDVNESVGVGDGEGEGEGVSDLHKTGICGICNLQFSKYTCPACGVKYCGLGCYKSDAHGECSEGFYKAQFMEGLKSKQVSAEEKKSMMEILHRMEQQQEQQDALVNNDDDDIDIEEKPLHTTELTGTTIVHGENGTPHSGLQQQQRQQQRQQDALVSVLRQFEDMDLDDADVMENVWETLSPQQRAMFEEQLQSGLLGTTVDVWRPWWAPSMDRDKDNGLGQMQLVQDMGSSLSDKVMVSIRVGTSEEGSVVREQESLRDMQARSALKPLADILKGKPPSSELPFRSVNVVLAYCLVLVYYNGDIEDTSSLHDVAHDIAALSHILQDGTVNCSSVADALGLLALAQATSNSGQGQQHPHNPSSQESSGISATFSVDAAMAEGAALSAKMVFSHPCKVLGALLHVHTLLQAAETDIERVMRERDQPHADADDAALRNRRILKRARKHLKMARLKVWFLCCYWNDVVQTVERGENIRQIKTAMESIQQDLSHAPTKTTTTPTPHSLQTI